MSSLLHLRVKIKHILHSLSKHVIKTHMKKPDFFNNRIEISFETIYSFLSQPLAYAANIVNTLLIILYSVCFKQPFSQSLVKDAPKFNLDSAWQRAQIELL